jgi:hypothetical protein
MAKEFIYTSLSASKTHTVTHNLNSDYPDVTVWDVEPGTINYKQIITASTRITSVTDHVVVVELNAPTNIVVQVQI